MPSFHDILAERGLVAQCTDAEINKRLEKTVTAYCGFDPTADSLHVGSLVPIMGLAHLRRTGHHPVVLVGGATGLVGDPSGKSEARKMLTVDDVNANARCIAAQIAGVFRNAGIEGGFQLVNNADWIAPKTWLEILREVGAKMSVNRMLSMDSVKGRLASEEGISYLEFSYMLMQAYDFMHLARTHGCTLQLGGQDQWGNIVMGIELARKSDGADLCGLTFPLVTKSDGGKFGKSEQGNVWLDAKRTSVFDFYQFWRNTPDADVARYLGYFTFLPMDEVRRLAGLEGAQINEAKRILAFEATKLVHGEAEAHKAAEAALKAFSAAKDGSAEGIPSEPWPKDFPGVINLRAAMVKIGWAKSNSEAARHIQNGALKVNGEKQTDITHNLTLSDFKDDAIVLQFGQKRWFKFELA